MRLNRVIVLAMLASACREGAEPYRIVAPEWRDSVAVRLTYSIHDDRSPLWNEAGDSVYYITEGHPPLPLRPGLLLATARVGGVATPILEEVQLGLKQPPWLAAARLNGQQIALVELTQFERYDCNVTCPGVAEAVSAGAQPQLREAVLRVHRMDANSVEDEYRLPVRFEGITYDSTRHPFFVEFVHVHHTHPFHRTYNLYGDAFFRPTWSPAGDQLVFSDGLNLYLWRVGQPGVTQIPGTGDGVYPAWSPDGAWIAFTRLERGAPETISCFCFTDKGEVGSVYETTVYPDPGRTGTLVVMRPDGSEQRTLGVGVAPAWMPNSQSIIAARDNNLWAIELSGAAQILEHTTGGFEPAISPDGSRLAFARQVENQQHDIWVVRLP